MSELSIRMATVEDAAAIVEIATQPSVYWGTLQMPHQTVAGWRKRLEGNDPNYNYVLVVEKDGKVVAMGGLHGGARPRTHHVWGLGIMVHAAYQGQGNGKALMAALLEAADNWLNAVRVELEVYTDNERAIKLYKSCGFVEEGVKRMNAFRDGMYADSLAMARIRPGFQG